MAYGSTPSTSGIAGIINNLPKKADYLGLQDFPSIEFRDTTPFSDDFFNIVEFPDTLTAGKNLFKLKVSSRSLVKDAKIYIEVLDSNGDTIYYEPLDYYAVWTKNHEDCVSEKFPTMKEAKSFIDDFTKGD